MREAQGPHVAGCMTALVALIGAAAGLAGTARAQGPVPAPTAAPVAATTAPTAAPAATPAGGSSQPPRQRWDKTVRPIASGKWTGPRLSDGQPDIQGDWSNTIGNHNNLTDPQGVIPNDPSTRNRKLGPRAERAPSRVSDPAGGEIPFQPWARVFQQDFLAHLLNPIKPEYVEPFARCSPGGIPKSLYWHGYEIRQYPGYLVFLFDSGTRIIHLNGEPPLPDNIKLWNGDSRGHWEGNTLVVDVRNNNSKARFARTAEFASENVKVQERYIFDNDRQHYNYVASFDDPTVFTRPFTTTIPARRYTVKDTPDDWHYQVALAHVAGKEKIPDHFERTCVENNGGFGRVALPSTSNNATPAPAVVPLPAPVTARAGK
jgi:hypothetical protein